MEPKRILLVFGKLNRGGAETLAMNIYRAIDREKIQFDFIVHTQDHCDYDDEITSLGGRIYRLPQYNILNHYIYKKAWRNFFEGHPEYRIIHAHMTGSAAVFLPIAKRYGLYTISHSHIALSQKGLRQTVINLYRIPLRNISDYLFACSDDAGRWLFGKNVGKRNNYRVIRNGVDTDKFSYSEESRKKIRKEFSIEENGFVLGDVARFHVQKNHTLLVDVFKKVRDKCDNAYLILVGDGELRPEIEQKVKDLGLEDCVIFTGVRTDIPDLLSAMDVFVMTSFNEGLPVALVEAQASGLHVVATDTISKEIQITDLVEMCSLDDSADKWAEVILKYADGYVREDTKDEIEKNGYDIRSTARELQDFYLEHWKD